MMFNKEWTFANALCVVFAVILIFVIIVTIDIINIMIKKKSIKNLLHMHCFSSLVSVGPTVNT